jgi:hypothetical protein
MGKRKWRTSLLTPFAANFAAVFFKWVWKLLMPVTMVALLLWICSINSSASACSL